jgi:hypothetical protein
MKHLKKSVSLLMLLTVIICSRTTAQDLSLNALLKPIRAQVIKPDMPMPLVQHLQYISPGCDKGNFFATPLLLNGQPLAYKDFTVESKGELTVIKNAVINQIATEVPFHVYLMRTGNKVFIPGKERPDLNQMKVDISEILQIAIPGDKLIIEAVRQEDAAVTTMFKVPGRGC